jgi:transcriptional regulator GlxA family with amidase domain
MEQWIELQLALSPSGNVAIGDTGSLVGSTRSRHIATVLFEGFELLDVFGPLEIFGMLPDRFTMSLVGPNAGPVRSSHGPLVIADCSYSNAPPADVVLVPGGTGNRPLIKDQTFLAWLARWASSAELVASVCTGSVMLASAGLLQGYRATSNKRLFSWAAGHGDDVEWVPEARWVEDRNRWTSSGYAAGMDMTLAIIARLHGEPLALQVARDIELEWQPDSRRDPFAPRDSADQP